MKLASFLYQGTRSYGIVTAGGVIDLGNRIGDQYRDLKALLQGMVWSRRGASRRRRSI